MNKAERWLDKTLHYRFDDGTLFEQALTHRSAGGRNNERLEFLGDSILNFVVSEALYGLRDDAPEGDLTRLRSFLVRDTTLAAIAADVGLGEHLILGSGEGKSGGHRRESILADAMEAIFGAVFLDGGLDAARTLIDSLMDSRYRDLPDVRELRDPKTRLQEWLQGRGMSLPQYELIRVSGKDHEQRFVVSCTIDEASEVTEGEAGSRRKAEQKAARKMIERLDSAQA